MFPIYSICREHGNNDGKIGGLSDLVGWIADGVEKMAKKHKPLPKGMNYAQVLAEEKRQKELKEQVAREIELKMHTEIYVQRALWMSVVSIADAYGFGPKRMEPYFEAMQKNSEEFDKMCEEVDYDYALEILRKKAEKVSGSEIHYMYEKELNEIQKRKDGGDAVS